MGNIATIEADDLELEAAGPDSDSDSDSAEEAESFRTIFSQFNGT
jgi:hypothetical protein